MNLFRYFSVLGQRTRNSLDKRKEVSYVPTKRVIHGIQVWLRC